MKTVNLQQGTPEWLQWRASRFTASDAPTMLGINPYRTRESLLREKATGERAETNQATERIFAEGHKFEALARPLAEEFIGEELFPLVCESGKLAASLDGATLDGGILWEHKTMNEAFRACRDNAAPIPEYIRAQVEHQMLVTGANRCLVTASVWQGNELAEPPFHGWIEPDNALRRRIIDGWAQFEKDVSEWKPTAEKPEGKAPEMLPALRVEVRGQVVASNLADFRAHAMAVIGSINTNLQTDEDFANAEKTVKWCKEVESRISGAKQNALAQTGDIDALFRALDEVSEFARKTRLNLEKQVKAEKDSIRAGRIRAADASFTAYCHGLMQEKGFCINMPRIDFAAVIHGLKTLASIDEKLGAALSREKSAFASRMDDAAAKLEWMREHTQAAQWASLFDRDLINLLDLPSEAFRDSVTGRIAKAQAEQAAREEAQRQAAEARARAEAEAAQAQAEQAAPEQAPAPVQQEAAPVAAPAQPQGDPVAMKDINDAIAPLSITTAGLEHFGFHPVETKGRAVLYPASVIAPLCQAAAQHLQNVAKAHEV